MIEKARRMRQYGKNYYAHNFLQPNVENKLRREGTTTKHFENPKGFRSNYFRPLK